MSITPSPSTVQHAPPPPNGESDRRQQLLRHWAIFAKKANAEGADSRSRELSLAITKVEEADHWLSAWLGPRSNPSQEAT
jgi:hypothetical protein